MPLILPIPILPAAEGPRGQAWGRDPGAQGLKSTGARVWTPAEPL